MDRPNFECRICGCREYEEERRSNHIFGPGGKSWIIYYTCCGCSVLFIDVNKFTKKVEEKEIKK